MCACNALGHDETLRTMSRKTRIRFSSVEDFVFLLCVWVYVCVNVYGCVDICLYVCMWNLASNIVIS